MMEPYLNKAQLGTRKGAVTITCWFCAKESPLPKGTTLEEAIDWYRQHLAHCPIEGA